MRPPSPPPAPECLVPYSYLAGVLTGEDEQSIPLLIADVDRVGPDAGERKFDHLVHRPVAPAVERNQTEQSPHSFIFNVVSSDDREQNTVAIERRGQRSARGQVFG